MEDGGGCWHMLWTQTCQGQEQGQTESLLCYRCDGRQHSAAFCNGGSDGPGMNKEEARRTLFILEQAVKGEEHTENHFVDQCVSQ